jgi:hypothetical protein
LDKSKRLATTSILLCLVGCAAQPIHPIDVNSISAVQANIKAQIGVYLATVKNLPNAAAGDPKDGAVVLINNIATRIPASEFQCGVGAINFQIASIKAELTTTVDTTAGVKFGLSVPLPGVTLGPSIGQSREKVNAQTLDFNLWPLVMSDQDPRLMGSMPSEVDIKSAPIARALLDLRNALILSATKLDYSTNPPKPRAPQPCFTDYDPANPSKDAGNLFKIAITTTLDSTGGLSVSVAPLTFTPSGEGKSITGNTLSVAFVQQGLQEVQILRDEATQECKFPADAKTTPLCKVAEDALRLATASPANMKREQDELAMVVKIACAPPPADADKSLNCVKAKKLQEIANTAAGNGQGIAFY